MDVIQIDGKKLGFINDLLVDFNGRKIVGFSISSSSLLKNTLNVLIENIINFNYVMVITKTTEEGLLKFKDIKGMDVRDKKGNIMGMIEDILFNEISFNISAVVVSTGFITDFIEGKKIILIKDIILGEENVLYNGKEENIDFSSLPHKLFMEGDVYGKNQNKKSV